MVWALILLQVLSQKPFLISCLVQPLAFSGNAMPEIDLSYSLSNFEKVQDTFKEIDSIINEDT